MTSSICCQFNEGESFPPEYRDLRLIHPFMQSYNINLLVGLVPSAELKNSILGTVIKNYKMYVYPYAVVKLNDYVISFSYSIS
jgi:hypothetical protein